MNLFKNIRFYVLALTALISAYYLISIQSVVLLTQTLALTAVFYLYLTLLAGPLTYTFKSLPYRVQYVKARRALGVSAFYFALLHTYFGFFKELGGFAVLPGLPVKYLIAISLNFISLLILALMASTANDFMIEKLGFVRWKALHRLVYIVGIFTLIHALLIGAHFQFLNTISVISYILIAFLIGLEIPRIMVFLGLGRGRTK